ncbi:unnamed protein product [Merluccius merluccius]
MFSLFPLFVWAMLFNHVRYDNPFLAAAALLCCNMSASVIHHRRSVSGVSDRSVISRTVKKFHNKLPLPCEKQLYLRRRTAWLHLKSAFPLLTEEAACDTISYLYRRRSPTSPGAGRPFINVTFEGRFGEREDRGRRRLPTLPWQP